jgi:hypothetical protein
MVLVQLNYAPVGQKEELHIHQQVSILIPKLSPGIVEKHMPYAYTGSIDDVQALDAYLAECMAWIESLKARYDIA